MPEFMPTRHRIMSALDDLKSHQFHIDLNTKEIDSNAAAASKFMVTIDLTDADFSPAGELLHDIKCNIALPHELFYSFPDSDEGAMLIEKVATALAENHIEYTKPQHSLFCFLIHRTDTSVPTEDERFSRILMSTKIPDDKMERLVMAKNMEMTHNLLRFMREHRGE